MIVYQVSTQPSGMSPKEQRSRWRWLAAGRQALLALAHLRNGDTPVGFEIGLTTAWRYIREAVDLLAATVPTLAQVMASITRLDTRSSTARSSVSTGSAAPRTVVSTRQTFPPRVNVQVIAECAGRLKWVSPALPGSTHDLTAAREHGIIDTVADETVMTFADRDTDTSARAAPSARRTSSTIRGRRCRVIRRPSTGPMPTSGPSVNGRTPL
jgi:hypothetical protein